MTSKKQGTDSVASVDVVSIPTLSHGLLSALERRFAEEYLVDLNATKAYERARPGRELAETTASTEGCAMLQRPHVALEIRRLLDERAMVTGITADRVLLRAWEMATADVRELVEYRIGACRHCWGLYHQHQYTDAEYELQEDKHIREQAAKAKKDDSHVHEPFSGKGGPGFNPSRPPNSECPECWGDGNGRQIIKDTRHLPAGVAAIYEGLKPVKGGGFQVAIADRGSYLLLVARHLGMLNDKLKLTAESVNPLQALIEEIQSSHSTLPIVQQDPERRELDDVEDVEPRPAAPTPARKATTSAWRAT